MFDVSSLIHLGNNNSIKKCITGELYMYISKKKKVKEHYPFTYLQKNITTKENDDYSASLEVSCKGNFKWIKCICFIKANFFYVYKSKGDYRPYVVFLLEGSQVQTINYHLALKNKVIEDIGDINLGQNEDIIQIKTCPYIEDNIYTFYQSDKGLLKKWVKTLNNSNFTTINNNIKILIEENEDIKSNADNVKKLKDIEIKNRDIEIATLNERIRSLKVDVENIRTKNKRLQIAADVNIKSADEFLQKKITEIEFIHNEMGLKIEEKKIKDIMITYEEACTEPEKITLINFNTNKRYQKIVLNNKNLKEEINKMNERFYELEDRYKEKIKTIKEIVEIGDIFDYLHKLIILCQTKIKFYEQCYKYNEEEQKELISSLEYMIKETKLSETNARVCYITHRSKILEERLQYYTKHKLPSDYFYFACTTLRRLGWVFGEIEALTPLQIDKNEVYPLYSYIDDMNVIPMREQIYFNEGIEGRSNFQIVNDVDIYSMPIKMCPYEQKILSDNKYDYIKIKLNDLKNDFNILKKKTQNLTDNMI
ncbi:conserved Plasmodium protein, unknown function [Plasmodium malariae]|uniref:PH domain-containing protein n=1 Tax=Plasmodium malariae TaxID=5858 RepID=A0A1C3L0J7_PLAMA|nr:conserved Plasmodium protein, unknown function [Plasmodium malariae]